MDGGFEELRSREGEYHRIRHQEFGVIKYRCTTSGMEHYRK